MIHDLIFRNKYKKFLLITVISVVIGYFSVIIGELNETNSGKGTIILLISLINFFIILFYIKSRFRKSKDFMDFGIIFSLFFIAYNIVLLLNVSFNFIFLGFNENSYPVDFEEDVYVKSSVVTFLACLGLLLGEKIIVLGRNDKFVKPFLNNKLNSKVYYISGIVVFLLGLFLLFLDFERIGGFYYALTLERGVRMELLSQTRGNIPYYSFIYSGVALLTYSLGNLRLRSVKGTLLVALLAIWSVLMLIQGDRRFLLYSLLIFASVYLFNKKINIKKNLALVSILYILFAFFQQIRYMIPLILNGTLSLFDAISRIQKDFNIEWVLPVSTEVAGPYFTLLWHLKYDFTPLYGYSYIMSIPNILPRSLYPGEKPLTIAQSFANYIHDVYYPFRESVIGWGFSPIAEAYINFGVIGVFIIFLLLSVLFKGISKIKWETNHGILIASILIPQAFNLNRINFSSVVQETFFNLLILILSIFVTNIVFNIKGYKTRS